MYLALFDRLPDAAGRQFYIDSFKAGTFDAGHIAIAVLAGAENSDSAAVDNKVQVANVFTELVAGAPLTDPNFGQGPANATYDGDDDAQAARDILKGVTSDPDSVPSTTDITTLIQTQISDPGDVIAPPPPPPLKRAEIFEAPEAR